MSDSVRHDSDSTVTLDFTPREIPPAERERVQTILGKEFRDYRLLEEIEPPTTIVSALRDRGLSPDEVAEFLAEHNPWMVIVRTVDIAPSWSEVCGHYAPRASPPMQDDGGPTSDEVEPDGGPDHRLYRVRGIGDPEDPERESRRSFPVIISLRSERVVAIN